MVFESLVVDLMNKYLGAYIENLDSSQLKLGIWGGDAVLENLHVKGDALKDLNLPVKIKSGYIGKLTLKIPWKNLYKASVEATLDGLFLLAVPNSSIVYDAKQEAEKEQQNKQDELQAIDDQQLLSKKGKEDKPDTFAEKLATQVIKNLQIHVSSIHVRYEEQETVSPQQPFSMGVTLSSLHFQTTNENWLPCILDESMPIIYKLIDLQCLSVYWNTNPKLFLSEVNRDEQLKEFKRTIATTASVPDNFNYIVKPITLQSKLRLNPHPLNDLLNPKITLTVTLQEVGLRLMHQQYQGVMQLVESMDRMAVNAPFRKFKPLTGLKGNAKQWWLYAYNSILSTGIADRHKDWTWAHIKAHRQKVRNYKEKYKQKLKQKNPPQALVEELISMENNLSVFNIVLARQTSEVEMVKAKIQIRSKQSVHQKQTEEDKKSSGWFGGWFGGSKKKKEVKEEKDKIEGLDSVMSEEEKKNLFSAIGYTEGQVEDIGEIPKNYVGTQLDLELKRLSFELADQSISKQDILKVNLDDVYSVIEQRPSTSGISVSAHLNSLNVDGMPIKGSQFKMVSPIDHANFSSGHLLNVLFETKPLDEKSDQRIILEVQPVQILYDADTINSLATFFKPPRDVQLQQLRSVAFSAYNDIKDQTTTGLQHVMDTTSITDISVHVFSSFIVVPKYGTMQNNPNVVVVDLGEVSFKSINEGRTPQSKKPKASSFAWTKSTKQVDHSLDLEELRTKAYDKFSIDIKKIQLLYARSGDDWALSRTLDTSSMHIIQPINLSVELHKCMITNDAALPLLKISGVVPNLGVEVSDQKLKELLSLVESIPLPPADEQVEDIVETQDWMYEHDSGDVRLLNKAMKNQFGSISSINSDHSSDFFSAESELGLLISDARSDTEEKMKKKTKSQTVANGQEHQEKQLTTLHLSLAMKQIGVTLTEENNGNGQTTYNRLLTLTVGNLSTEMNMLTYEMNVSVILHFLTVQLPQFNEPNGLPLYMLTSKNVAEKEVDYLLSVNYLQVKPKSPQFNTLHKKTKQKITVKFGTLKFSLHSQAIVKLGDFAQTFLDNEEVKTEVKAVASDESKSSFYSLPPSAVASDDTYKTTTSKMIEERIIPIDPDIIDVHVDASLNLIELDVMDQNKQIAHLDIKGIKSSVTLSHETTKVHLNLLNITVCDPSPNTLYSTILSSEDDKILMLEFIAYNNATKGQGYTDPDKVDNSIKLKMGCVRVVFLYKFVNNLLGFTSDLTYAKQVAIETAADAQVKVSEKAYELAESNPRILLDITLSAPKVVIPMNSMSREALVAHLGILKANNSFVVSTKGQGTVIEDKLMVSLTEVKMATCELDEMLKDGDQQLFLTPITVNVEVIRNLSASWYHSIPDVSVTGEVPSVSLEISSADVQAVMTMLDENLNETESERFDDNATEEKVVATVATEEDTSIKTTADVTTKSDIWDTLKVSFNINSINLKLFADDRHLIPLSSLQLHEIKSNISMRSDQSVAVGFILSQFFIEDCRKSSEGGITKLVLVKVGEGGVPKQLIDAQVSITSDGSTDVVCTVSSLNIIINVEFIMKVVEFMMKGIAGKEKPKVEEIEGEVIIAKEAKVESHTKPKDSKSTSSNKSAANKSAAVSVSFILEEPEIVLVTDIHSLDSEAILLGMKMAANYNSHPRFGGNNLTASISNLNVMGCSFKTVLDRLPFSSRTHKKILNPFDVTLRAVITDTKQDFDVQVSPVHLKASPITINALSEVSAQLSLPPDDTKEADDLSKALLSKNVAALWTSKKLNAIKLWFVEEDDDDSSFVDMSDYRSDLVDPPSGQMNEIARISIPMIQITLEAGMGHHTVPLLITECHITGRVNDWSGNIMDGWFDVTLGTAYFNDSLSLWEPLIEPVELDPGGLDCKYEPWKLTATIQTRKPIEEDATNGQLPPLSSLSIESNNTLQITLTNAAYKVINDLSTAFKDAALTDKHSGKKVVKTSKLENEVESSGASVVVLNYLGFEVGLTHGPALCAANVFTSNENYKIENNSYLLLDYIESEERDLWSVLANQTNDMKRENSFLDINPGNIRIDISYTGSTLLFISVDKNKSIPFVANVSTSASIRTVTLRSHIVVYNHTSIDFKVFNKSTVDTCKAGKHYQVSLDQISQKSIQLQPVNTKNQFKACVLSWERALIDPTFTKSSLTFTDQVTNFNAFKTINISTLFEEEKFFMAKGASFKERGLVIHLRQSAIIKNYLPTPIQHGILKVGYNDMELLQSGSSVELIEADIGKSNIKIKIPSYQDSEWYSNILLNENLPELSPWEFKNKDDPKSILTLAKQITYTNGVMEITLYSPYWMVNKTGLPIDYQSIDNNQTSIQHPENATDAKFFAFASTKKFLAKNKLQLRVCNSSFSDGFSIDTVGSSGSVECKAKQITYMIGTQISLTSFGLTKVVTFTPYYIFNNKSDQDIELKEFDAQPTAWNVVLSGKKFSFWPKHENKFFVLRLKGVQASVSNKFRYNQLDSGVLVKVGDWALFVEVGVTEAAVNISVRNYFHGASAVYVVNDLSGTELTLRQGRSTAVPVKSKEARHLLWSEPTEKRELLWENPSGKNQAIDVYLEQTNSVVVDNKKIYYVLLVDGLQRVLFFTESERRSKRAEAMINFERASFELDFSLQGISLSLTDSSQHREVAFLAVNSSGVVWQEQPKRRWKALPLKYSNLLEQHHQMQAKVGSSQNTVSVDKYEFDLDMMRVVKPYSCPLKRTFQPGVWLLMTSSDNQMSVHAKVNELQLDNQLPEAIFPVVLSRTPLPRSIAAESTSKPFAEVSIMQRTNKQQTFTHIKYFKVLVQEFSVKVDMGFIFSILPIFGAESTTMTAEQDRHYFLEDVAMTTSNGSSAVESSGTSLNFYDVLHLSPIKIHVSFSMQNTANKNEEGGSVIELPFNAFSVVLKSIGVTVSDIDDIVFKLAYFERKFQFYENSEFLSAVSTHYTGQAMKQLYVLVLGLDVIGNPYGLVMGIADGVADLFYEPYQGIIQGPEEFFEGLGIGAMSLLGHTFGGAAGAVSKVAGALGKGIATITMDEDYKKKRLENKPADLKEGLARGGKGVITGIFGGVTGIVTKPLEGAKNEGASGFFKGVGKGLIGAVARPVGGIVDLASNTFEGLQKATDMTDEVERMRPPRWIDPTSHIIQPYCLKKATGMSILRNIDDGNYAQGVYVDHATVKQNSKREPISVILVDNLHVFHAHTGEILGKWKVDWKFLFEEMTDEPKIEGSSIKFSVKLTEPPPQRPLQRALSQRAISQPRENIFSLFGRRKITRTNTSILYNAQTEDMNKTKGVFGIKTNYTTSFDTSMLEDVQNIVNVIIQRWNSKAWKSTSSFKR